MTDLILKSSKILIVDDQQANIDVLTGLLDLKGYTNYLTTTDPQKVVSLFSSFKPDLLLLDLIMPHLNGFQVMEQLQLIIPTTSFFPILVLTADITFESKAKALAGGAADFLTKPFDLIEVELRIKNLLQSRSLHQQILDQNDLLEVLVKQRTMEIEIKNGELIEAIAKAEEMNKLKSIFLDNMSHELRTPLIPILGFAELLQLELTNTEHLEFANQILEGGNTLKSTINSILELSQLESDKSSFILSQYNMADELKRNIKLFETMAKEKNLFINTEIDDQDLLVNIDPDLFGKIFFQLIQNAVKFTFKGGIHITLNKCIKNKTDWAVIHIIDSGIGISKENFDKIFLEFRQGSEGLSRTYNGSGIGLSIAKKMIELMNGKIEIESEKGIGSNFSIWLPAIIEENSIKMKINENKLNLLGEFGNNYPNFIESLPSILLIEDNLSNRMIINRLLLKEYNVVEAPDGIMGILYASQRPFDLVLIDINLGDNINGIEVLREIRKIPGYASTPIVAMTAYAMPGDKERFLNDGFDDYLQKPFIKNELIHFINNLQTRFKQKKSLEEVFYSDPII
jgi:signal transduction histidine kinase